MLSRCDAEEGATSRRLIFRTSQMHVPLHRINRFQRFSSQIKVEDKRFNWRWASLKPVDSLQSYMHLRRAKNKMPRGSMFFTVAARYHLLHRRGEIASSSASRRDSIMFPSAVNIKIDTYMKITEEKSTKLYLQHPSCLPKFRKVLFYKISLKADSIWWRRKLPRETLAQPYALTWAKEGQAKTSRGLRHLLSCHSAHWAQKLPPCPV